MAVTTFDAPRPLGAVRKTLRRPQFWVGGIALLITFGWYGVFVFAPMIKTLVMSFQRYRVQLVPLVDDLQGSQEEELHAAIICPCRRSYHQ